MDEFLQSISKGIKERLSSAFIFNFLMAWVVFNWEFVYITLFVDEMTLKPFNRYDTLQDTVFVVWPAIFTAFGLSIISPFINSIIQLVKYAILKLRDWAENKIDGKVVYTDKQYADLKMVNQKLNDKFNRAIKDSENDKQSIINLEQTNRNLEEKIKEKEKENNELGITLKHTKESFINLKEAFDNKEIEYLSLQINNEELRNFGFFDHNHTIINFQIVKLINANISGKEIIKQLQFLIEIPKISNAGKAQLNLEKKTFNISGNDYIVLKYFNDENFIDFLVMSKNEEKLSITVTKLLDLYYLLRIYNIDNITYTDYVVTTDLS